MIACMTCGGDPMIHRAICGCIAGCACWVCIKIKQKYLKFRDK